MAVRTKSAITTKVLRLEQINWESWEPLQNENLKEISKTDFQKLKTSIVKNNFIDPFIVWYEKPDKGFIIGGKHRRLALIDLKENGYTDTDGKTHTIQVPETLPALVVDFKNKKEAAQAVLVYSSKYAHETQEGLYEFMNIHGIKIDDITSALDLPTLDLDEFSKGYFEQEQTIVKPLDESPGKTPEHSVVIPCKDEEQQLEIFNKLKELGFECRAVTA